ncbi:MAG: glycoside hydrolase family 3 C-terminal domain-containing protein [Melioribacteraceae bacterium]|nr:glycoside hydrolase family 3 C-terminal domain-containing protein [Melioribacteraceae bacterium]
MSNEFLVENNVETSLLTYQRKDISIEERTKDLLSRMTIEEKIAQMICIWGEKKNSLLNEEGNLDLSLLLKKYPNGIGQIARLSDTANGLNPYEMVSLSNKIQKIFIEQTRLGIPVIFHEECLHGLAGKDSTSYPQPIALASTFNPDLIEKIYSSIAEEVRARGAHQALTPVVDVAREPRWGRVEETFGEDPYLVSRMGIAAVKGFQGDGEFNDYKNLIATLKHFAAHGQPESGTNCAPVNVSERLLRDTFLYPFKAVIKEANAMSVMASYNEIDGVSSHANKWLLRDVLRNEFGFKGFVVSDYYAITELNEREEAISHSMAYDKKEAAKLAVEAGVNIEFPDPDCYPLLIDLINENKIDISLIDELVYELLYYKFKIGLFDNPYTPENLISFELKLDEDRKLALESALQSLVLLKNENNYFPLDINKKKKIALIGPNANRVLLGGYSGKPKYYVTVLDGLKEKTENTNVEILYAEGCRLTIGGSWEQDEIVFATDEENEILIKEAIEVAKNADDIILVLGDNEQISREAWNKNHMGDRADLNLFGYQNKLAEEILNLGKPVSLILINGRPISITNLKYKVNSILECWYLGQETGSAIAKVIFGEYNPGGKLPISFPRSVGHLPCYYNYKPSARRGYLADDISPLFPFGFGLSYTKFVIENIHLEKTEFFKDEEIKVTVDVKNIGDKVGDEVVQLYIRDKVSSVTRPIKELKSFKRVTLNPNETKTIEFILTKEHLSFTNIDMNYCVEDGEFEILIGNSSKDEDLIKALITVKN